MVRLCEVHFRKYRKLVDYTKYVGIKKYLDMSRYVYTPPVPEKLANAVSGKGDRVQGNLCLQELSLMLACWKDNDYSEVPCAKETQAFEKCWHTALVEKARRQKISEGTIIGKGPMSSKQVNSLLKRYPQPKS
ncbi:small ribosomal subunit protein mS37-like [Lineus longissimus]|uniref:small ribosomal subunit protein mS37-like n=1 Tax=Lineus longissimus TaxID=88925 RepID=UPI00315E001C